MANYDTTYDESLSGAHISSALQNYEAARTGFFTFTVDKLDGIVRAEYTGDRSGDIPASDTIPKAQTYLKLNVLKADVPHFSITPLEYKRGNDVIKFAGVPTFESGTIVVDDIVGLDTKAILMAWQALAYDVHTRRGGRMKDYKKTATLTEYTQDFQMVRKWQLYGCWISALSEDSFDRENDGKRQISATIQYDRAELERAD